MKRSNRFYIILFGLIQLLWMSCQEEEMPSFPNDGIQEGMVTITLQSTSATDVVTRANELVNKGEEEAIEHVTLLLFDNDDQLTGDAQRTLLTFASQQLVEQNNQISLYLEAKKQILYAICNFPDVERLQRVQNVAELKNVVTTIDRKDGAYTGRYIMEGKVEITPSGGSISSSYTIPVKRIAAAFNFTIQFKPTNPKDQFEISSVYIHNIPKGSYLLHRNEKETDSLSVCHEDYVYASTDNDRQQRYFWVTDKKKADSLRLDLTPYAEGAEKGYKTSFVLFENRQGGVADNSGAWTDLEGLKDQPIEGAENAFVYYRQIRKREIAIGENKFLKPSFSAPYASYMTIHGVYRMATGAPFKVVYYIYLGKDNYKDFNIRRNHSYLHHVVIRSKEEANDSRVEANSLQPLEIYGEFTEKTFDAHCNSSQVLMYARNGWTVEVASPDETPWLEVSKSAVYVPRKAGEPAEGKAAFKIEGTGGLQYFYIHTDEFVPKEMAPSDNKDVFREGKILCRSGNYVKECTVRQYAAQMVICHIDYDALGAIKNVNDTFYVERLLEKKNLQWGFLQYWSFITDSLISKGQWNGMLVTQYLYKAALDGDKWGIPPAYPADQYPDGVPVDIALGYVVSKNRDRNGNGKIDPEEIVWYLPAANELQALSGHIHGNGKYYETTWNNTVTWTEELSNFHSSSPSVADPSGFTTGRSYYVNLSNGKKHIGLRSRKYNVIAVRKWNAPVGDNTASVDGNFNNNPDWEEDEEEIMPKPKK